MELGKNNNQVPTEQALHITNVMLSLPDIRNKLSPIKNLIAMLENGLVKGNGSQLGAVAVFGARNCQFTTKADARHKAQLSTKPAIEPSACYRLPFFRNNNLKPIK